MIISKSKNSQNDEAQPALIGASLDPDIAAEFLEMEKAIQRAREEAVHRAESRSTQDGSPHAIADASRLRSFLSAVLGPCSENRQATDALGIDPGEIRRLLQVGSKLRRARDKVLAT